MLADAVSVVVVGCDGVDAVSVVELLWLLPWLRDQAWLLEQQQRWRVVR